MTERIRYRGLDTQGQPCEGVVQAPTLEAARLRLLGQGIRVVELQAGDAPAESARRPRPSSIGAAEVLLFTRELAQLKRANLPLDKALAILRDLAPTERLKRFVSEVADGIRGGKTLYQALQLHESSLGQQYLAMIRAGEVSGNLQLALTDLAAQLEADARQRGQLITALTYPAILLGVSVLSVFLLLLFVVPQFRSLFDAMGDALPLTTRWVLALSDAVRSHWQVGLLLALAVFLLVRQWYARPSGRLAVDCLLLRLPVLGDVVAALQSAVYFRTLGMLLQRGVPMLDALRYAAETLTNQALAAEARPLVEHAKAGRRLSDGFLGRRLGERGAASLIRVAEETGQLAPTLARLGERFEEDSRRVMARLLSMVEPLIIIALGTIVAFIIIAILGGVLSINEAI
ncbi:MAG: type II secretion system F family protein [Tepidimonas sp.]|nr:type II secretion system F family protein [Tepidimonas sp.]